MLYNLFVLLYVCIFICVLFVLGVGNKCIVVGGGSDVFNKFRLIVYCEVFFDMCDGFGVFGKR